MFKNNLTQFLMVFVCLFAFSAAYAQPIFTEDFEGTVGANGLPAGFTETGNSVPMWSVGNNTVASSQYVVFPANTNFAYINDDDCNCDMGNERMILPQLDFSAVTGVSLNFDYFSQQYYGSTWGVEVSTDSGLTWTSVLNEGTNTSAWSSKSINLSAFAGQAIVWISFRYQDAAQWAGGLGIDNISIEPTPAYDLAIGVPSEDANGWTRDHIRIPGFQFMPVSQLELSELLFGATLNNRGSNPATNAYVRLNIDQVNGGTLTNVYTDTIRFGTIQPDSIIWAVKEMTSMTWAVEGEYRYQYIAVMDSADLKPASDTIVGTFTLTENMWSKVDLATDGGPFGDNAYLPGVTAPNFVSLQEWGTLYYMPNGAGLSLDTLSVRFFVSTAATATSASYQARIYKIVDNGDGQLRILDDRSLRAIVSDTVAITPGAALLRNVTNFLDINTFETFEFQDTSLYYISIYQQNTVAPGLNNGTIRNGLFVYGQTINHDGFVYGDGSNFQFYNPLIVQDGVPSGTPPAVEAFEYGWSGGPEPSIALKLAATPTAVRADIKEMEGVELFPNPTVKEFTVTLNLDNASDVRFILTDISGRVMDIKYAKNVTNETRTWDIANYPAGVYFLHVNANGQNSTKRIVKK
jgi:hypothetical protein